MIGSAGQDQSTLAESAILADALLGGGLPPGAEYHLHRASLAYHDDDIAERHLRAAEAIAPDHAAILIGLYRFYFYKGRLGDALVIARRCLAKALRDTNLAADWQLVQADDAEFGRYDALRPRFFLFTLKGYAYLQMRLGNVAEGQAAINKLLELDPSDKVGAKVLLDVINRIGRDDDE
jgi:tetratricopeptide (TPR) repeat protein